MNMNTISLFILFASLISVSYSLSETVNWARSVQIKSGQHKLVLATLIGPTSRTQDQPYQMSVTYNNIPNVAIGIIIMDFDITSNPIGYTINIANITKTQFISNITVNAQTTILELRYMYFTIDPTLGYIQIYQIPYTFTTLNSNTQFNASETITKALNSGSSFDSTHENLIVPFVKDFQITPQNNFYSLRVDQGAIFNSTHFTVKVFSNATLSKITIFVFWADKTVVQAQQKVFIDFGYADGKNSQQTDFNLVVPTSGFDYFMFNQGMNWINIATGGQIQINFENNPMTTSGTYNYIRKFMFHFRFRNCATYTYYLQAQQRCYDTCPIGYADLSGSNICVQCDYSCVTCLNDGTTCLTCSSSNFRTKSGTTCPCNDGYFDNSVATCATCDYTCLTCVTNSTNCLTCPSTRTKNSTNACLCNAGFFDDGNSNAACLACDYTCTTCSTNATHCLTCSSTANRLLTSANECRCKSGFSQAVTGQQQCTANPSLTCTSTCQTCQTTSSTCTSCLTSQNRQLSGTSCVCVTGFQVTSSSLTCNEVCGNGIITTNEECDDGNKQDGDGCSSACTIQSNFTCNLTVQPTYCKYNLEYSISYLNAEKDPLSNRLSLFFNVAPIAPSDAVPTLQGISNSSQSYSYSGNTLKITIGYKNQILPSFSTKLTLSNTGTSSSFNIVSSNKLRVKFYPDSYYNLYQGQIIFVYIIIGLAWLIAIILTIVDYRNIGSVLEMLTIASMSWVGVMGTKQLVLLYYPLEKLYYLFTYNSIFQDGGCVICVLNYGLIFLITPLLGFLLTLGIEKIFKLQGQLQNLKRFFLFDFPYALICLFSYLVCYGLAIQAVDKNLTTLSIVSIPFGVVYLIIYIAVTIVVILKADFFTNIKTGYLKQFHFLILNFLRQSALIIYVGLSQTYTLGSLVVIGASVIIIGLTLFLKPFVNNFRPILNQAIILSIFVCFLLISEVYVAEWSGFLVLVLLVLLLLVNTLFISWDTYKRRKLQNDLQEAESEKDNSTNRHQNEPQWDIVQNSNSINSPQNRFDSTHNRYDTGFKNNSPQLEMKSMPRNGPRNVQRNDPNDEEIRRQLFASGNKRHLL